MLGHKISMATICFDLFSFGAQRTMTRDDIEQALFTADRAVADLVLTSSKLSAQDLIWLEIIRDNLSRVLDRQDKNPSARGIGQIL